MAETGATARPGRRPLPPGQAHRHEISVRLTSEQFSRLQEAMAADLYDGSISTYTRQLLVRMLSQRAAATEA